MLYLHRSRTRRACAFLDELYRGEGGGGPVPVGEDDFDDDFDDDYDSFRHTDEESGVQLGTVLPLEGSQADRVLFKNVDWHDWDGGKAGGWPVSVRIMETGAAL